VTPSDPDRPRTLYARVTPEEVQALTTGAQVVGTIAASGDVPALEIHLSMIPPSEAARPFTPVTEG
jgi:hypothetical protein